MELGQKSFVQFKYKTETIWFLSAAPRHQSELSENNLPPTLNWVLNDLEQKFVGFGPAGAGNKVSARRSITIFHIELEI